MMKDNSGRNWVEEKRGMLMVVGTMISTMTFQAAINPPGGFWQDFNTNSTFEGISYCNAKNPCLAGTAVSSYIHPEFFNYFQVFNTACFVFSMSITHLLVSGFPLRKRLLLWLLVVVMCLTLQFLTLTFYYGVQLVLPNRVSSTASIYINGTLRLFWLPLLALVILYHTARFLIWLVKKLVRIVYPKLKRSRNSKSSSPQRAVHSQEVGSCV
ncbi:hypothetical protein M0R45_001744 [Rubus argutus]|uniref:PGG domain-containing protein n=1 Tax=Rubus argutus TaxID=59490 RepID=A0AAW1VLI2_RUBAR